MYQLNQHGAPSRLPPSLLVIVVLTTILIIPGFAWPSEDPTHSSHYDDLKGSIAALSAEVNSVVSIVDTLKSLQARIPQPPPHQSRHLQTTIQGLTKEVATLQTQMQGLGGNVTHLAGAVDALAVTIGETRAHTGGTETISNLSEKVGELEKKVTSLTSKQDSYWHELVVAGSGALFGIVSGVVIAFATKLLIGDREQKKERAKERLEKFYAPVLGRLKANEDIWRNFTNSGILNDDERTRIIADHKDEEQSTKKQPYEIPANILSDIYRYDARRKERLEIWIAAMEGIFRLNNEAAEEVILENYGYLSPDDLAEDSPFHGERIKYLQHVGEFKSLLHHWDEARSTYPGQTWYQRCCESCCPGSPEKLTIIDFLKYFHPTNPYPDPFLTRVQESYKKLMDEARLKDNKSKWRRYF